MKSNTPLINQDIFYCNRALQFSESYKCLSQCNHCLLIQSKMESEKQSNEMLEDMQAQTPSKFKWNITGIYFVGSLVCVIWKIGDLISYLIHKL